MRTKITPAWYKEARRMRPTMTLHEISFKLDKTYSRVCEVTRGIKGPMRVHSRNRSEEIRSLKRSGKNNSEIASVLGVSLSTVVRHSKGIKSLHRRGPSPIKLRLIKNGKTKEFKGYLPASIFLRVHKTTVRTAFVRGRKCKGWTILVNRKGNLQCKN